MERELYEIFAEMSPALMGLREERRRAAAEAAKAAADARVAAAAAKKAMEEELIRIQEEERIEAELAVPADPDLLERLRQALATHDWWYRYSDDGSVWAAGKKREDNIEELIDQVGIHGRVMFNEMAPKGWGRMPL